MIWFPALAGALFVATVKLGHMLYRQSIIGARGAIGLELAVFLACLAALVVALVLAFRLARARRWPALLGLAISLLLWFVLLGYGFQSGAALLYAT